MSGRPREELIAQADIVMSAEIEADEMEVRVAPDHAVEFRGEEEAGAGTVRENLPDHVTEGKRYRAAHIRYTLAARAARFFRFR
ncbi:hypothetical protein [Herbidospora mongoliensis]|uniref:hypothetical protein n=1 Tax=Herbidospora mongoliensis TaxID=688067 RepID=UPI0008341EFB|nr:hypothetical protein [Herbidospora mongoliensis]